MRKKIYKYYSFSSPYWETPFKKKYLYFASLKSVNDPYEAVFTFSKFQSDREVCKFLKGYSIEMVEQYNKGTDRKKREILKLIDRNFLRESMKNFMIQVAGISCFSKSPRILPMWSHYSQIHSGFCLEFDTELLDECAKGEDKINWKNVKYVKEPPEFNPCKPPLYSEYISHKHISWQYEQEVRAWRLPTNYYFKPECITSIYLGSNIFSKSENLKKIIKFGKKDFPHLKEKTYRAEVLDNKYKIKMIKQSLF
ncbi:MAG: DUF2971 domain-containing protein [Bdellovibrionales bacterium]|nr:DUF2971 domain-containing protein [Bdellovibrionales bacterium]